MVDQTPRLARTEIIAPSGAACRAILFQANSVLIVKRDHIRRQSGVATNGPSFHRKPRNWRHWRRPWVIFWLSILCAQLSRLLELHPPQKSQCASWCRDLYCRRNRDTNRILLHKAVRGNIWNIVKWASRCWRPTDWRQRLWRSQWGRVWPRTQFKCIGWSKTLGDIMW